MSRYRALGLCLLVLGAGSLLLPRVGFQFTLMQLVDAWQPYAGIVLAIIGAALSLGGARGAAGERPADEDAR